MLFSIGAALLTMGVLVAVLIGGIGIHFALKHIGASNELLRDVTQLTAQRVTRLRSIGVACDDDAVADLAARVADDLRFSDSAFISTFDEEIDEAIEEAGRAVRAGSYSAAEGALDRIVRLSQCRAVEETCVRRGSF